MEKIKNEITLVRSSSKIGSRIGLLFFGVAIAMSFKYSGSISIDQGARNQAKLHESQLQQLEEPNNVIEKEDAHSINSIQQAIKKALGNVS